ncbi:MAG: tyrosine-type recombinase/integrase [bacterium]
MCKITQNKKQRVIPLNSRLMQIINEYLQFREGEEQDYLFCIIYGLKLSTSGFNTAITRYNKGRGVDKTSTHLFRYTFAKL